MKLTKNFTLEELTRSNTALRLGLDNKPSKEGVLKLTLLASSVLQPLREVIGAIRITSGYRSVALNKAIGGSSSSQHCKCEAVDLQYFKRGKMDNITMFNSFISLAIDFDQLILEFGGATETKDSDCPDWIHLSWKTENNRRQVLVAYKDENNKTKYRRPNNYIV